MMQWPDLFPDELAFCRKAKTEQGLIDLLLNRSDEAAVWFFEVAADDETWALSHPVFFTELLRWFSKEFSLRRLRLSLAERLVAAIHKHVDVLGPLVASDMSIEVQGRRTAASSLLFGGQSAYFRDLIEKSYSEEELLVLRFDDVSDEVFQIVLEAVAVGSVENLWRLSLPALFEALERAGRWQFWHLAKQCAEVARRYVDENSALEILRVSQRYALFDLKKVCCEVLNTLSLGAQFTALSASDLQVSIEEFRERYLPLLYSIAPLVTQLAFRKRAAEQKEALELTSRCSFLQGLDVSHSEAVSMDLMAKMPALRMLDISACAWLDDAKATQIMRALPSLRVLTMKENPQLGFEAFRAIAAQTSLEQLFCIYCSGLQNDFLEIIARRCSALIEISIAWCPQITDEGLAKLSKHRPQLRALDISHLVKVTDVGLRDLVRPLNQLERLIMQQLPLVTEEGIEDVLAFSPKMKHLDIRLCQISKRGLDRIKESFPYIKLLS